MSRKTLRKRKQFCADLRRKAGDEALPGYHLIEPLGRGGFGEVWKCEAPGGLLKAVKFIPRDDDFLHRAASAEEELEAIQRVKAIRHPFLLSIERVECVGDDLIIVSELADKSLDSLLQEHRAGGQPGIPRDELLGYLREAAEALDVLNRRHGLVHLDVKPRNLFLVSDHVKLGDFGLVAGLDRAGGDRRPRREALTPLYAAPEVFEGAIHRRSDQYSLAIVYQELLTGVRPFQGSSARQVMLQHCQEAPDLEPLPARDRPIVARALHKAPDERFASCGALLRALVASRATLPRATAPVLAFADPAASLLVRNDSGSRLETVIVTSLPRGLLKARLEGFRQQWLGQLLHRDDHDFVFHVRTPRGFWQRWLGRHPGLEVHIHVGDPDGTEPERVDVTVRIQPRALGRIQAAESLEVIGRLMLEAVRGNLQATPRRRGQERLLWPHAFEARAVLADGQFGEAVSCKGLDISLSGIGFLAPRKLESPHLALSLPRTPQTPAVDVAARVVRSRRRDDDWWEMGAILLA